MKQTKERNPPADYVPNPTRPGGRQAVQVTDRALRYRANRNAPPGPRVCHYCGSDRSIDVEHVDGREENTNPANLTYACRSCNTLKGAYFARARVGRKTRQYNGKPRAAGTMTRWANAVMSIQGGGGTMSPREAIATIQATPHAKRTAYAAELARAKVATALRNPEPTYQQYLWAVKAHARGAHDEGGKVIHATSKATRSSYARRIAAFKRQRRGSEVPF